MASKRRSRILILALLVCCVAGLVLTVVAHAQATCSPQQIAIDTCTPQPSVVQLRMGDWNVRQKFVDDGHGGVRGVTEAWSPGHDDAVHLEVDRQGGHSAVVELPIWCRRDDYAFLPPSARGGLPCLDVRHDQSIDPRSFASQMVQSVSLPPVRLEMNPRLGMVAVPTWFWVEGYDGGVFGRAETLLLVRRTCRLVVDRDARGDPLLDEQGRARVHETCTTTSDTLTVEVRLWPKQYVWDFGDQNAQPVACSGIGPCPAGLGEAYVDSRHPSPIRHSYIWTSIDQGDDDAYRIGLAIDFAAQFRVSFNSPSGGQWQELPGRSGAWAASHQVQEAQAVLTRPR
jgi:hypothetical protein